MTVANGWLARLERFDSVGSTNDIVSGWLRDGTPEVCVAIADEQTAGRGRNGRTWISPPGASLLVSVGFRPAYLPADHAWRLAAIVALAMAEAAEASAWLPTGTIRLKWPNDLVAFDQPGEGQRKLAGVLGETRGLGTENPEAVVGIGVNVLWSSADIPPELGSQMTDLSEVAGLQVPLDRLTPAFLHRLQSLHEALSAGEFPSDAWRARQVTNGMVVRLERPDGSAETVRAIDVDAESGALVVGSVSGDWPTRLVTVGEIRHLRLGTQAGV